MPADLLWHADCHLLILPPTPVRQRTSPNLNCYCVLCFFAIDGSNVYFNLESRSNKDPVADIDLDAPARALPYILDISVHRLCIIVTYIFNSALCVEIESRVDLTFFTLVPELELWKNEEKTLSKSAFVTYNKFIKRLSVPNLFCRNNKHMMLDKHAKTNVLHICKIKLYVNYLSWEFAKVYWINIVDVQTMCLRNKWWFSRC